MQRVLRGAVFYFTLKFLCVSLQNGGHAGCIISIEQNVFVCIILEGSSLLCAVRTGYGVGESRAIKGVSKVYADTAHGAGAGAVFLQVEDHGSVHLFGVYALLFGVILQCFLITLSVYDVSSFPLAYDGTFSAWVEEVSSAAAEDSSAVLTTALVSGLLVCVSCSPQPTKATAETASIAAKAAIFVIFFIIISLSFSLIKGVK